MRLADAARDPAAAGAAFLAALARGEDVDDDALAALYPESMRGRASVYWTPASVAARAATLLVTGPETRVLDVGSGAGLFCIVGAALTGAAFVGVEQRGHLVALAEAVAARVGVARATFRHAALADVDTSEFDAFYFFNPFEENLWASDDQLDQTVPLSRRRFVEDVELAGRVLAGARDGTRVVTYHGYGGAMPPAYRLVLRERHPRSCLEVWEKGP
jgi:SAM-dependent methyltransferase